MELRDDDIENVVPLRVCNQNIRTESHSTTDESRKDPFIIFLQSAIGDLRETRFTVVASASVMRSLASQRSAFLVRGNQDEATHEAAREAPYTILLLSHKLRHEQEKGEWC